MAHALNSSFQEASLPKGMCRYVMAIEYCGDRFYGWQRQALSPTVQAEIEDALTIVLGRKIVDTFDKRIVIQGSGRTDTGVHAFCQYAHFDGPEGLNVDKIQYGLNFYLEPKGAVILSLTVAPPGFHARFSALQRRYRYVILNRRAPSLLSYARSWHVTHPVDADLMDQAAQNFVGFHDFTSFRDSECQAKSPLRSIDSFSIQKQKDLIVCEVAARSFLHHQVRIMIGTLKEIGAKGLDPSLICHMLEEKNRAAAGQTAPAHGLFFMTTRYPDEMNLHEHAEERVCLSKN